jgi:drug/metabolite transporter (DMT)-like permease
VLLVSQPVGLVLTLAVALAAGGDALSTRDAAIAAGAGATVVMALGAFYRAMALGSMTVVATIGAVAVAGSLYSAVTVLLARFVLRERMAAQQQAGVIVALAGVALIAAGS